MKDAIYKIYQRIHIQDVSEIVGLRVPLDFTGCRIVIEVEVYGYNFEDPCEILFRNILILKNNIVCYI